jgi:DNA-directed RNA polymerase subunit RPC12/RpoP
MLDLVPCASCGRHVRVDATACPFCASKLLVQAPRAPRFLRNAGRAAIFYLGASMAGCGSDPIEPEETIMQPYGAPPEPDPIDPDGPQIPEETIAQPYGAPPIDPPDTPPIDPPRSLETTPIAQPDPLDAPPIPAYGAPAPAPRPRDTTTAPAYGAAPFPDTEL